MNRFILFFLVVLTAGQLLAVPAYQEIIDKPQPDGTTLHTKIYGDEYFHYETTEDGYRIGLSDDGYYHYISIAADNITEYYSQIAHNPSVRDQNESDFVKKLSKEIAEPAKTKGLRRVAQQTNISGTFPLTGSPKSLVILVNFSDVSFVTDSPQESFTRLLNQSGYSENNGVGSARDYFIAASDSAFQPVFDVCGPYTLSNTQEYYGGNSGSSSGQHVNVMIAEACQLASEAGIHFSQYDTDNNGMVDNVFVYYAGHNEAEGGGENTIWPHRSTLLDPNTTIDGARIYDYACTSELRGSSGNNMCGIGTFCHEFGHVLGLPDFYDTGSSGNYTVGSWDIMCSGSYNGNGKTPPTYTSFERFSLGWLTPIQLSDAGHYSLEPLETSNSAYLIAAENHNLSAQNPSPSEYFMVENRQFTGWDASSNSLPGHGMLVWHINYLASAWSQNIPNNSTPLRMDLVEAHGRTASSSTPADPYPGTQQVTQMSPVLHNGTILSPILDIQEIGTDISFVYKNDGANKLLFFPTTLDIFESTYNKDTRESQTPVQQVILQGMSLDPETSVSLTTRNNFQLSLDSVRWTSSSALTVKADSSIEQAIYLRYHPGQQACDMVSSSLTARCGNSSQMLTLQGLSIRPTYIQAPQIDSLYHLTPYSFTLHWKPETDAEEYYVSIYRLQDNKSVITQSFENFSSASSIVEEGWTSTTTTTTTTSKSDGSRALWLQNSTDIICSQTYVQPVTQSSFWLNAMTSDDDEVGNILLEAFNGSNWTTVETIAVQKNTKKYTYTHTFAQEDGYIRFRISYEALGGNGVTIDAFTATCEKEAVYLYKGKERMIEARNNIEGVDAASYTVCYIGNLDPQTEYYYQIQCYENKGCEEHLSDLSTPVKVTTLSGEANGSKRLTVLYENGKYIAYVPEANTNRKLYIYSVQGQMITQVDIQTLNNRIELPTLPSGHIYLLKYSEEGKMRRKDLWGKFICQ